MESLITILYSFIFYFYNLYEYLFKKSINMLQVIMLLLMLHNFYIFSILDAKFIYIISLVFNIYERL